MKAISSLLLLTVAACSSGEPAPDPMNEAASRPNPLSHPLFGTGTAEVEGFLRGLAETGGFSAVACLPLVSHDMDATGPRVTALGSRMGDEMARFLERRAPDAVVLTPLDVESKMLQLGLPMNDVYREEALPHLADRLGVQVIVTGSIREYRVPGSEFGEFLQLDLRWFTVPTTQSRTRTVRLNSEAPDNRLAWSLMNQDARWGER